MGKRKKKSIKETSAASSTKEGNRQIQIPMPGEKEKGR